MTHVEYFARGLLTGPDARLYDEVVAALKAHEKSVSIGGADPEQAFKILNLVRNDHPEFYWVGGDIKVSGFVGRANMTMAQNGPRPDVERAMRDAREWVPSTLPLDANDYTKAKAAFGEIVSKVSYDWAEARNPSEADSDAHTIAGPLLVGAAVCDGYAAATQYLLQTMGVMAYKVSGSASSEFACGAHSWLLVRMNGKFSHMDPTWGDLSPSDETLMKGSSLLDANYDYFSLSNSDIAPTHSPESLIELPKCSSRLDSYYRRESYVLQVWSEEMLVDILARQCALGCRYLAFQAATEKVFLSALDVCANARKCLLLLERAWKSARMDASAPQRYSYFSNRNLKTIHIRMD